MIAQLKSKHLLILLLFIVSTANAQRFKGEIIAGANFSQVDGDMVVGYKKIFVRGGLGAMLPFSWDKYNTEKKWAVSMEILYNPKGARQKQYDFNIDSSSQLFGIKYKYNLTLHYVSLPIMIHYYDRDIWSIGIGLQYSRLVNYHEIEYDVVQTYDSVARPKANDLSVLVDVRVRIWQQLKAGCRFEYSIIPIRTRDFQTTAYYDAQTRKQFNNSLSLYLVYMLNEKKRNVERKSSEQRDKTYYY